MKGKRVRKRGEDVEIVNGNDLFKNKHCTAWRI